MKGIKLHNKDGFINILKEAETQSFKIIILFVNKFNQTIKLSVGLLKLHYVEQGWLKVIETLVFF